MVIYKRADRIIINDTARALAIMFWIIHYQDSISNKKINDELKKPFAPNNSIHVFNNLQFKHLYPVADSFFFDVKKGYYPITTSVRP